MSIDMTCLDFGIMTIYPHLIHDNNDLYSSRYINFPQITTVPPLRLLLKQYQSQFVISHVSLIKSNQGFMCLL